MGLRVSPHLPLSREYGEGRPRCAATGRRWGGIYRLARLGALVAKLKLALHQGHTLHLLFSKHHCLLANRDAWSPGTELPAPLSLAPNLRPSLWRSSEPAGGVSWSLEGLGRNETFGESGN